MDGQGQARSYKRYPMRILSAGLLWVALIASAGCVADRSDALNMRDEVMFEDLALREEERSADESREVGENLRRWTEEFKDAESITLADCFRLALNNSEELLIQGEKLLETWTLEREAIADLLPQVGFNWAYTQNSDSVKFGGQTVSPRDTTESWLSARQILFDGRSFAAVSAARESQKIEQLTLKDERDRLLFAVASAFYIILGLEEDVDVFEASLASADEFYRVLDAQWRSGEASRQELMSAKAQRDLAESQLIETRHAVKIARADLTRLLGLEELPEKLTDSYEVTWSPGSIPDLVKVAQDERSDLGAARAGVELAEANRMAERADYYPLVTADYTYWTKREGAFSDEIDWTLGVNLFWNLFDSGGREARQARALSGVRQQELAVSSLEKQIRFEVEEAVYSFQSMDRMLNALRSRAEASEAAHELANAEYQAAEATNLDVMIARRVWEEAARDLARTQLARKLAALKIRLVIGGFKMVPPLVEAMEEVSG